MELRSVMGNLKRARRPRRTFSVVEEIYKVALNAPFLWDYNHKFVASNKQHPLNASQVLK